MTAYEYLEDLGIEGKSVMFLSNTGKIYSLCDIISNFNKPASVRRPVTMENVLTTACFYYQLSVKIVTGPSKVKHLAEIRGLIMLYLHNNKYGDIRQISKVFNRDYSSVSKALHIWPGYIFTSDATSENYNNLKKYLDSNL